MFASSAATAVLIDIRELTPTFNSFTTSGRERDFLDLIDAFY